MRYFSWTIEKLPKHWFSVITSVLASSYRDFAIMRIQSDENERRFARREKEAQDRLYRRSSSDVLRQTANYRPYNRDAVGTLLKNARASKVEYSIWNRHSTSVRRGLRIITRINYSANYDAHLRRQTIYDENWMFALSRQLSHFLRADLTRF